MDGNEHQQFLGTLSTAAYELYISILEAGNRTETGAIQLDLKGIVKLRTALRTFLDTMDEVDRRKKNPQSLNNFTI